MDFFGTHFKLLSDNHRRSEQGDLFASFGILLVILYDILHIVQYPVLIAFSSEYFVKTLVIRYGTAVSVSIISFISFLKARKMPVQLPIIVITLILSQGNYQIGLDEPGFVLMSKFYQFSDIIFTISDKRQNRIHHDTGIDTVFIQSPYSRKSFR